MAVIKQEVGRRSLVSFALASTAVLLCASTAAAMTVTSTGESGSCSLRAAINAVNTNNSSTPCGAVVSGGPTPIHLAANTYTLTNGQVQVAAGANLEIVGANINAPAQTVIDAGNDSRVLEVLAGGQATLSGVKVTGGRSPNGSNGASPGQYGGAGLDGGGILNRGALTLDRVLLTGNVTGDGGRGADGGDSTNPSLRSGRGGGLSGSGGGVFNAQGATLTVSASTITGNGTGNGGNGGHGVIGQVPQVGAYVGGGEGGDGGSPGSGGGILNLGTAIITDSTISDNFTGRGGHGGSGGQGATAANNFGAGQGGYGGDGGSASFVRYEYDGSYRLHVIMGGAGIANVGTLQMSSSTISGNVSGAGGNGGAAGNGGLETNGQYRGGSAGGYGGSVGLGGGLLTINGRADLINVTISGNRTGDGGNGGAGSGAGWSNTGPGGYGGYGGGVWSDGAHSPYYLRATHVTISGNFVGAKGSPGAIGTVNSSVGADGVRGKGAGLAVGGRYDTYGASVSLKNTIVAANGFPASGDVNCVESHPTPSISDLGNNLTFPGTSCPGVSADPDLGPLTDNGGVNLTMLPQSGSPVIAAVPLGSCANEDQRAFPRPAPGKAGCDIGAVETGPPPDTTPTTTALSSTPNPSKGGQAITFTATVSPAPVSGTVAFTDGGSPLGSCGAVSISSGQAKCSVAISTVGSHSVVAAFSGNGKLGASSSAPLIQTVQPASQPPRDTKPPKTIVLSAPKRLRPGQRGVFRFRSSEPRSKFRCKLDGRPFRPCTSPHAVTLQGLGPHTLKIVAIDAAGNVDATPASRRFVVRNRRARGR